MSIEEQIAKLNETVKCRLAPSPIHGVGVFAIRDIKAGDKMYCRGLVNFEDYTVPYEMFDEIRLEVRELILDRWPLVKQGIPFQSPNNDARLVSFMNDGGDDSNYDPHTDKAIRNISEGSEVLEDYKKL